MRTIAKVVFIRCPNCETPIEAYAYDWTESDSDFRTTCHCGTVTYFRRFYDGRIPRNDPNHIALVTFDTFKSFWDEVERNLQEQ